MFFCVQLDDDSYVRECCLDRRDQVETQTRVHDMYNVDPPGGDEIDDELGHLFSFDELRQTPCLVGQPSTFWKECIVALQRGDQITLELVALYLRKPVNSGLVGTPYGHPRRKIQDSAGVGG